MSYAIFTPSKQSLRYYRGKVIIQWLLDIGLILIILGLCL